MIQQFRALLAKPAATSGDLAAAAQAIDLAGAAQAVADAEARRARALVDGGAAELREAETALAEARLAFDRLGAAKGELDRRTSAAIDAEREAKLRAEIDAANKAADAAAALAARDYAGIVAKLRAFGEATFAADREIDRLNLLLCQTRPDIDPLPSVEARAVKKAGRDLPALGGMTDIALRLQG